MFKHLAKLSTPIKSAARYNFREAFAVNELFYQPKGFYTKETGLIFRNERQGYYIDPNEVARRLVKLMALHDNVKNPEKITLDSTFIEHGFDELSFVELMLEAEDEFYMEFPDDDVEKFRTVNEAVQYISRSFYSQ